MGHITSAIYICIIYIKQWSYFDRDACWGHWIPNAYLLAPHGSFASNISKILIQKYCTHLVKAVWFQHRKLWNLVTTLLVSRVIKIQPCSILNLVVIQCGIDKPVLCLSGWVKQHKSIRSASAWIIFLVQRHFSGAVKNSTELFY